MFVGDGFWLCLLFLLLYFFFQFLVKKKKKKKSKKEIRPFGRVKGKNVTEYYRRDKMTYLKVNPKSEVVKCVSIAYHFADGEACGGWDGANSIRCGTP